MPGETAFCCAPPSSVRHWAIVVLLFSRASLAVAEWADRYENVSFADHEARSAAAQKLKIGFYSATWWVLNEVAEAPKTDLEFWKSLAPLRKTSVLEDCRGRWLAHTVGHVAATVSMSKVAASFTHIIKSGEPAFSVLVSRFPVSVYPSLVPVIGGVLGAMISNLAFVFRNIFSKREMNGKSVSGMNYYACLSMLSLLILPPFAIAVEGPQMWSAGWQKAISWISPHFVCHTFQNDEIVANAVGLCDSYLISIGNTMKRISVIVSSIIIFHTPVQPINALGAAIAIFGTFLDSQAKQRLLHLHQFRSY
ncbi:hypothetical protein C4D60_Mb02t14850 [Musa balbisiana]|uniref:Sugar phosphate transporter domain-containing protein n=1 Tax=Musa balbisiana TaxID=52838 RepID=A0A4S8ID45_MUSBA|nr:hypothetical protein C4D60_Mb02t14850 [Musa balbisiana]